MKALGFNIEVTLEYSDLFNSETNVQSLLSGVDRKFLMGCASLFLSPKAKEEFSSPKNYFKNLFCKENQSFVAECAKKLEALVKVRQGKVPEILNEYSSLKFCEEALKCEGSNSNISTVEKEQRVFKAYILINENLNRKQDGINEQLEINYKGDDKIAWFLLLSSFHNQEIVNYDIYNVIIAQIKKVILLFNFLKSQPQFEKHLETFLDNHSSNSSEEYLRKILPVLFGSTCERKGFYSVTTEFEKDDEFLNNWAVSPVNEDFDFINIRTNPLYKIEEHEYRVLFPLFMIESLYNGLYFKLNSINSGLDESFKIKNFRRIYTTGYSEKYLLYCVLKDLYGDRFIQHSGQELDAEEVKGAPDYYIRYGNKVFLFECKDVLIEKKVKTSVDFLQLEKAIKEKFYKTSSSPKAIIQQVNCIEKLISGEHNYDSKLNIKKAKFYPIIITHYRMYDCVGFNKILIEMFNAEIERRGIQNIKICSPTIVCIDDLINYKDFLKDKTANLEDAIVSYSKYTTYKAKQSISSESEAFNRLQSTYISFSKYLSLTTTSSKNTQAGSLEASCQ